MFLVGDATLVQVNGEVSVNFVMRQLVLNAQTNFMQWLVQPVLFVSISLRTVTHVQTQVVHYVRRQILQL